MSNKTIFKLILIILTFSGELVSQDYIDNKIEVASESFESFSDENNFYLLEYIKEKETLHFWYRAEGSNRIEYAARLEDIHPEGIFLEYLEDRIVLKILSMDNGKVFTHTIFRGQMRQGKSTNIIDIEFHNRVDAEKLNGLVANLKALLVKAEIESDDIILPPPTLIDK